MKKKEKILLQGLMMSSFILLISFCRELTREPRNMVLSLPHLLSLFACILNTSQWISLIVFIQIHVCLLLNNIIITEGCCRAWLHALHGGLVAGCSSFLSLVLRRYLSWSYCCRWSIRVCMTMTVMQQHFFTPALNTVVVVAVLKMIT